jgi:hypothetical protein
LGAVAHSYNPSSSGGRDLEDYHSRSALTPSYDPISTNKNMGVAVHTCHPSYVRNVNTYNYYVSIENKKYFK